LIWVRATTLKLNKTNIKIILLNVWTKETIDINGTDWRKCLENGILKEGALTATSGLGQIPKFINRNKKNISFRFRINNTNTCLDGRE